MHIAIDDRTGQTCQTFLIMSPAAVAPTLPYYSTIAKPTTSERSYESAWQRLAAIPDALEAYEARRGPKARLQAGKGDDGQERQWEETQ